MVNQITSIPLIVGSVAYKPFSSFAFTLVG